MASGGYVFRGTLVRTDCFVFHVLRSTRRRTGRAVEQRASRTVDPWPWS